MLEFSGGNEIAHLLGVFMRSKVVFFFALFDIRFNTSKTGKGCDKFYGVLNFLHLLRDKSKKDCGGGILKRPCGHYYVITHLLNYR